MTHMTFDIAKDKPPRQGGAHQKAVVSGQWIGRKAQGRGAQYPVPRATTLAVRSRIDRSERNDNVRS